ncbi:hypothetical protein [Cochlodiniinecator piscidefendens]|uniref:hypothetical protein n=1 Tax=Cochlodiniinecator piscidefendens TaxID=2715756 RepID=UPI00140C8BC6|nr:hypothetical protein [Cochlodiniinecator piscidefendens]
MKAIAEYFQDLASNDRYFGAEPPTPDAEMLTRIAEREIQKRVEAKISDSGVVLRAAELAPPEATASAPVAEPTVSEPATEAPAVVEPQPAAPVAETAEVEDVPETQHDDSESIAAKLQRIRAVVSRNEGSSFDDDESPVGFAGFEDAEVVDEDLREAEAVVPEINEDLEVAEEAQAETGEERESADDALEQAEIAVSDEETVSEDNSAEIDDLSALLDRVTDFEEEQEEPELEALPDVSEYIEDEGDLGDDTIAAALSAIEEDISDDEELQVQDIVEEGKAEDSVEDAPVAPMRARVLKINRAALEAATAAGTVNDLISEKAEAEPEVEDEAIAAAVESSLSQEDEDDLLRQLAEVEELEPTVDLNLEEEDTAADISEEIDLSGLDDLEEEEFEPEIEPEQAISPRRVLTETPAADEESVDRLLRETNTQLEQPESSRRRSAISHLRAAVAATVADRKLKQDDEAQDDDNSDSYREDLASVMRPKQGDTPAPSRRVAPLMLVSEQRVDQIETPAVQQPAAAASPAAVRPRRVQRSSAVLKEVIETEETVAAPADDNIFAESVSFADFAERLGATELPDLLEAAAAYTSYVQGLPNFSRPQVMRQVAAFQGRENFNREDGLRSFGHLLREGKIVKIKRGQFEISETTQFKPAANG